MILRSRRSRFLLSLALTPVSAFFILSLLFPLPPMKPFSLVVEDRHGRFLHAFLADDGIWRIRTSPAEIPERLKRILVEREDRWFYVHPGVNPAAVLRAFVQNISAGERVSGASTITMQIARMLDPGERTYGRKVIEMFRALQLEVRYSKEELLELYLSLIPLGGNIEGVASAAMLYYQTPPERLNIAQLFDLILLPGDPNRLRPDLNPDALFAKRKESAERWLRAGFLTRQDSIVIWTTPAAATRESLPRLAPHFALRIRERERIGGTIRSTLDYGKQQVVQRLLTDHLRPWKQKGVRNGAVIVLENRTGSVVAYTGSEDFFDAGSRGQVDAVRALRSPGSTLKPFLYAMEMEHGALTPRTRLLDTPYDAEGFLAENYDGTYSGAVYADEALRRSLNVPMVRLLKNVGFAPFVDFLGTAGFGSLLGQRDRLGLSMILGGCGVTLEELATAYSIFPRGGEYLPASFIPGPARWTASGFARWSALGHVSEPPTGSAPRIISSSTAYLVTEILSGLERPDLPNQPEAAFLTPMIAYKTGTSYGRKDAWAVGYTRTYTAGVWVGNVDNRGNPELVGSKSAAPLLTDILTSLSDGSEKEILRQPEDVGLRKVCAKSGRAPGLRCTHLIEDLYSRSQTLSTPCDLCREYAVSENGSVAYCPSCIGDRTAKSIIREDYPPELLDFWRKSGVAISEPPPHNPLCTRVFTGGGPLIVSPSEGMTYYVSPGDRTIVLRANSGVDVREHVWYMDDRFMRRKRSGESIFLPIDAGTHTITCVDDRGRASRVSISVRISG